MKSATLTAVVLSLGLVTPGPALSQAADRAAIDRAIASVYPSLVRISVVAVVLDGTGLTVTALSQLDPSDMIKRVISGMPGAPEMNLSVDQSNIRMRLGNGREVPVRIVLRDKDLDLVFLRPIDAPASPMASVDMATPAKAQAVFDTSGRFLGLIVMRSQSAGRPGMFSMMQGTEGAGMLPVVLPGRDRGAREAGTIGG